MKLICRFLIIIISFTVSFRAYCQREVKPTHISGLLVDSVTNEPLPFAAIFLKGSDKGTMTDENGNSIDIDDQKVKDDINLDALIEGGLEVFSDVGFDMMVKSK